MEALERFGDASYKAYEKETLVLDEGFGLFYYTI